MHSFKNLEISALTNFKILKDKTKPQLFILYLHQFGSFEIIQIEKYKSNDRKANLSDCFLKNKSCKINLANYKYYKQMSSEVIVAEREPESYEDFAYRFQLAQGLPQDERGIIFIGNTRAGKSTLALAMSGAAMKVVYADGALTYLNPSDKAFKDIVRNTHQSVTDRPNFYPSRQGHNRWSIVDMPGHADSSRFRELINFHYIRTMAANLKEVRFLLVVTLQFKNGKFELPQKELLMLNSFRNMFPNCGKCVNVIINRIEDVGINTGPASACFRDTVMHSTIPGLGAYYSEITNNKIHVIERPSYRKGSNGEDKHEAPYSAINKRMQDICNNNSEFLKISEFNYDSPDIFKAGDSTKNAEFYHILLKIIDRITEGVSAASNLFKSTFFVLLRSIVAEGKCKPCEDELINIFDIFLGKYSVDTPQKRQLSPIAFNGQILLESSKILQLLQLISQDRFTIKPQEMSTSTGDKRVAMKRAKEYFTDITDNYCSKLLQIIQQTFGNGQLYGKVMEFYLFILRRISEYYFLTNILLDKESSLSQNENTQKLKNSEFILAFQGFQQYHQRLSSSFQSLVQSAINFNVPNLFRKYSSSQYEHLKAQLFNNFNIIQNQGYLAYPDKDKFNKGVLTQISIKRDEINFFTIVNSEPNSPQQTVSSIEKLLKVYNGADLNMKIAILHKLAKFLEKQKQYKHAVVLYIHLSLNEDAMRLLAVLEPTIKKETVGQLYSEVASAFEENAMFYYAQRCLQMAKRCSMDELDRFIQYEHKILNLNNPSHTSKILSKRLEAKNKESYWNWAKINDQILFLKQKYRIKDQSPTKSVVLKGFR